MDVEVCVIGAGPRGTSVLERLIANAGTRHVRVHVVDPYPPGPGRIWQADQPGHLLMNTLAAHATLFTDSSVDCAGPVVDGPSLFEWAQRMVDDPELGPEARAMDPWSHPSRAFQGKYYAWVFDRILATAGSTVDIVVHRTRAVALSEDGRQQVELASGDVLSVDAVVITVGHTDLVPDADQETRARFAAEHALFYAPPAHPLDLDLSPINAGEPVLVAGLGMNFFDVASLLTLGRGGRFESDGQGLRYLPSGAEPVLWVGSRRGVPYRAKPVYGALPPVYPPRFFDDAAVARLRAAAPVNFGADVWPLIAKDAWWAYFQTLDAGAVRMNAVDFGEHLAAVSWTREARESLVRKAFADPGPILSLDQWDRPLSGVTFDDRNAVQGRLIAELRSDLGEAMRGSASAMKAATTVIGAARTRLKQVVAYGGIEGQSFRTEVAGWFTGFAASQASGPPARRIEEVLALSAAGLLRFLGPSVTIECGQSDFVGHSPVVRAAPMHARAFIEARLPEPDLARSADPLLRQLVDSGAARPYVMADPRAPLRTGALEVTEETFQIVDAAGHAHPRRFALGIPLETLHYGTALGAAPRSNAPLLAQSDAVARAALATAGHVQ